LTVEVPDGSDDLVLDAMAGSSEATRALFQANWEHVWKVAYGLLGRRAEADDVAQEAFISAFSSLPKFEQRSSFRTWITRIAINKALNALRQERGRQALWEEPQAHADDPGLRRELLAALASLPPERRTVVVLRYWLGYSITEIAELLAVPAGTINSRLARGLEHLRSRLEVTP